MTKLAKLAEQKTHAERQSQHDTGLRHVPSPAQFKVAKALRRVLGTLDDDSLLHVYGWMQCGKQCLSKGAAYEAFNRIIDRERRNFDRLRIETAIVSCEALSEQWNACFTVLDRPF